MPWPGLTSACPPGDRTLWQCSHFRQKRCQFLPRELTFSAVGKKVGPGWLLGNPLTTLGPVLLPSDREVSSGGQLHPARVPCPTGRRGVGSGITPAPALAQSSPTHQPGPHRRKRVAGNVGRSNSWLRSGLRAAGAAHSRHWGRDSVPAPGTPFPPPLLADSTHGSALSLIGLNQLFVEAH